MTEETQDEREEGAGNEDREGADADELRERLEEREERIDELEDELVDSDDRADELESRVKRVQADFQNYKKRAEERREEIRERATEDLVGRLLDVRDDLDRALEAGDEGGADDLREGIELVRDELDVVLEDEGVDRVETDEFDPESHEAMMRVDSDDHEEGEVVDVYEPGYVMAGRVLRPAKVTVATGDEEEGAE